MKSILPLIALISTFSAAATLDGTGVYTGKVIAFGCDANSENCKLQMELPFNNGPAGCSGKSEVMWYGRTPSGSVMTAQIAKSAVAGRTFVIQLNTSTCFLGNASYPSMSFYNIF